MYNSDGSRDLRDPETYAIIGSAMEVHRLLGSGFLKPAYQEALEVEFGLRSVPSAREVALPIHYKGIQLRVRYCADFVCFGSILVELKAIDRLTRREESQVVNYLAAGDLGGWIAAQLRAFPTPVQAICRTRVSESSSSESLTSVGKAFLTDGSAWLQAVPTRLQQT